MKSDVIQESLRIFYKVHTEARGRVDALGNDHTQFGTLLAGIVREELRLARALTDAVEAIHRLGFIAADLSGKRRAPKRAAGGLATAKKMTAEQRRDRARKGGLARAAKLK
jgi:hypothetical protein